MISRTPLRVFLFFWASTLTIGFFLQLVLLPHLLPSLHAGNGLMVGHDSVNINAKILSLLPQIQTLGASALLPFPSMDYYYYIVGFLYLNGVQAPWIMLPLNTFMVSLGALFLYLFLTQYTVSRTIAFFATFPLVFLPSSLGLYTQLQRDCFVIAGIMGFLWSWNGILRNNFEKVRIPFKELMVLAASLYFIHIFRGYLLSVLKPILLFSFVLSCLPLNKKSFSFSFGVNLLFFGVVYYWSSTLVQPEIRVSIQNSQAMDREIERNDAFSPVLNWHRTEWVPPFLEEKAKSLVRVREGFLFESTFGVFNIDENVSFHEFLDFVRYAPRAIQIGLFAPFPSQWFQKGKSLSSSLFRSAMVVEMILLYFSYAWCVWGLYRRKDPIGYLILFCCLIPVFIYPLVVINLGTLYRLRFPWIVAFYSAPVIASLVGKNTGKSFQRPLPIH